MDIIMYTPLLEFGSMRKTYKNSSLRRRSQLRSRNLFAAGGHRSFDLDELQPDTSDMSHDEAQKALDEFREGARYEYVEEHHNYFEIKYW